MSKTKPVYVDWFLETAKRMNPDLPAGWKWFRWTAGDDKEFPKHLNRLEGCVPGKVFVSGKRKGQSNFKTATPGTKRVLWFTESDRRATFELYEATTGICYECSGNGEVFASWNIDAGAKYRTCPRCNGSRVAPGAAQPAGDEGSK